MAFSLQRALEGKAVPNHPVFNDRTTPITTYAPGAGNNPREDAVISQGNAGLHSQVYGGSQAIDWFYDCVGLYADPISTAPFRLQKPDGTKLVKEKTKGTPPDHQVGPADLYRLLEQPNDHQSYDELMYLLVVDLFSVGNAYWFKWQTNDEGKPLSLFRMAPSHVKIKPGPFGPKSYEYQPPGARKPMKIDAANVIHFRRPNPHDPYYGMGLIQGGGRSFDLELAITDTMAHYYENRADPSLVIQSERRVPRDVFAKLRAQLRARTSGPRNAGEMLLLESGLTATALDRSAADNLFEALSAMSRNRVYAKFRANPMLFGIMDETAGSNKISDARREFDAAALSPFMERLSRMVTRALCAAWGVEYVIDYDMLMPVDDALKVAAQVAVMPGVKMREVRRQYRQFGIEESTGDPELDELVLNVPGEELDEDGQGGMADNTDNGTSRPGRPALVRNTTAFGPAAGEGKALSDDPESHAAAVAHLRTPLTGVWRVGKGKVAPETLDSALAKLEAKALVTQDDPVTVGNKLTGERRPEDRFASLRRKDIDAQQATMTKQLRDAVADLEVALVREIDGEGKALKSSNIVQRMKSSAAWKTFQDTVEKILMDGARRSAQQATLHSGLDPEDEVDYDAIAKAVVHRPEGLAKIVRTLKDRVALRISKTRDANGERNDYEAAIRAVVADWSDSQAVTVADSEATEAYNEGTLTVSEMSGVEQVFVEDGHDHDQPCQDADGSVWTIDEARKNRKEHPRCRRAFIPMASDAEVA